MSVEKTRELETVNNTLHWRCSNKLKTMVLEVAIKVSVVYAIEAL